MFAKILVPYDGSVHSQRALRVAAELARCTKAAVHVVNAVERRPAYLGKPYFREAVTHILADAVEILDEAAGQIAGLGLKVTSDVLEGPPAEAILRLADTGQFDLIVMGSRGFGQVEGLLLGSVSDRVLHHARVPVMIVRHTQSAQPVGEYGRAVPGARLD